MSASMLSEQEEQEEVEEEEVQMVFEMEDLSETLRGLNVSSRCLRSQKQRCSALLKGTNSNTFSIRSELIKTNQDEDKSEAHTLYIVIDKDTCSTARET